VRVTGDEQGVRFLKQMYAEERAEAMAYLYGTKKRGVAYFRALKGMQYLLYEIRYQDGDVYHVSLFQEGSTTEVT
jgi:hypothetical protein